uniref:Uncharacterized protein n=1 Tax=Rhizophora mucronata TaxID=61149 RepID=A0A2P2PE54_RHIMU
MLILQHNLVINVLKMRKKLK